MMSLFHSFEHYLNLQLNGCDTIYHDATRHKGSEL